MHYYKRNLGDYAKKAGRLSMLQHGSYTLLIDACYDREQFPTMQEAVEWSWASSAAEIEAVEFVLRKFFELENGLYVQARIKEEIDVYHQNAATNKRIANERETNRKQNSMNRAQSVNEPPPNHKPLTINQEPVTNKEEEKKSASAPTIPDIPESLMSDFLKVRRAKKAPLTDTAIKGMRREAEKAGITITQAVTVCVENSWQGFRADWYTERTASKPATRSTPPAETFAERDARSARERWEHMTNRQWPADDLPGAAPFVIDVQTKETRRIS